MAVGLNCACTRYAVPAPKTAAVEICKACDSYLLNAAMSLSKNRTCSQANAKNPSTPTAVRWYKLQFYADPTGPLPAEQKLYLQDRFSGMQGKRFRDQNPCLLRYAVVRYSSPVAMHETWRSLSSIPCYQTLYLPL